MAQTDGQILQVHGDAPTTEWCGTGADIRVNGFQLVREGGVSGGVGGGIV